MFPSDPQCVAGRSLPSLLDLGSPTPPVPSRGADPPTAEGTPSWSPQPPGPALRLTVTDGSLPLCLSAHFPGLSRPGLGAAVCVRSFSGAVTPLGVQACPWGPGTHPASVS